MALLHSPSCPAGANLVVNLDFAHPQTTATAFEWKNRISYYNRIYGAWYSPDGAQPTNSSNNKGALILNSNRIENYYDNYSFITTTNVKMTLCGWIWPVANISSVFTFISCYNLKLNISSSGANQPPSIVSLDVWQGSTSGSCSVSGLSIPVQQWSHIAVTNSSSNSQNVYLNGNLVGTGNFSWDNNAVSTYMSIGGPGTNALVGQIYFYSKDLSIKEIRSIFNAAKGRYGF